MSEGRFSLGIDLGTTNCALASVSPDLDEPQEIVSEVMPISQLTAPGTVEERPLLPSFLYLPHPEEFPRTELALPWNSEEVFVVGELARSRGTATPIRLVASAKSWLCHQGVDRRAPILPPEAPQEIGPISPLEASIRYLSHIRDAWNHVHPDASIEEQDIVLTVPASFDPAARELTAEAAGEAGFKNLVLLEEPQAAFYSWIQATRGEWRKQIRVGEIVLVVDVGGGTTDLSLIAVTEQDGAVQLRRIAVGDHILLGGDNMDLALAHLLKNKLAGKASMDLWQLQALTHGCRAAKEALFSNPDLATCPVAVPSRGSKLFGKTLRTELTREEVEQTIVEGFFPIVDVSAVPLTRARGALTRVGLPYAQDPGITRHLAAFLKRQVSAAEDLEGFAQTGSSFLHPSAVLFNGGVFKAEFLVKRTMDALNSWLRADGGSEARLLEGADLDMAVAKGAAITATCAVAGECESRRRRRSFYVGIESDAGRTESNRRCRRFASLPSVWKKDRCRASTQTFGLVVGEPVKFRFFGSSVRRTDSVGTTLESWAPDELEELDNIESTLPADGRTPGDIVPVRLHARLTEVGT